MLGPEGEALDRDVVAGAGADREHGGGEDRGVGPRLDQAHGRRPVRGGFEAVDAGVEVLQAVAVGKGHGGAAGLVQAVAHRDPSVVEALRGQARGVGQPRQQGGGLQGRGGQGLVKAQLPPHGAAGQGRERRGRPAGGVQLDISGPDAADGVGRGLEAECGRAQRRPRGEAQGLGGGGVVTGLHPEGEAERVAVAGRGVWIGWIVVRRTRWAGGGGGGAFDPSDEVRARSPLQAEPPHPVGRGAAVGESGRLLLGHEERPVRRVLGGWPRGFAVGRWCWVTVSVMRNRVAVGGGGGRVLMVVGQGLAGRQLAQVQPDAHARAVAAGDAGGELDHPVCRADAGGGAVLGLDRHVRHVAGVFRGVGVVCQSGARNAGGGGLIAAGQDIDLHRGPAGPGGVAPGHQPPRRGDPAADRRGQRERREEAGGRQQPQPPPSAGPVADQPARRGPRQVPAGGGDAAGRQRRGPGGGPRRVVLLGPGTEVQRTGQPARQRRLQGLDP